jgi:DNA mismatch repair protein MSH6
VTNKYQRVSSFVIQVPASDVDPLEMPPKPKESGDLLKQKNLTAFFTKASTSGTTQTAKATSFKTPDVKTTVAQKERRDKDASRSQTSSSPVFPKTPGSDSSDIPVDLTSPAVPPSSVLSSRRASSPATSDIINVDMLGSDEEDQSVVVKTVNIIYSASIYIILMPK